MEGFTEERAFKLGLVREMEYKNVKMSKDKLQGEISGERNNKRKDKDKKLHGAYG